MKNIKRVIYCSLFFSLLALFSCEKKNNTDFKITPTNDKLDILSLESKLEKLTTNQFLYIKIKDSLDVDNDKTILLTEFIDYEYPMPSKNFIEVCLINSDEILLNNVSYNESEFSEEFLNNFKEIASNDNFFTPNVLINIDVSSLKSDLGLRDVFENIVNSSLNNFDLIRKKYSIQKYDKSFSLIDYNKKRAIIELLPISIYIGNNSACNKIIPPPPPPNIESQKK